MHFRVFAVILFFISVCGFSQEFFESQSGQNPANDHFLGRLRENQNTAEDSASSVLMRNLPASQTEAQAPDLFLQRLLENQAPAEEPSQPYAEENPSEYLTQYSDDYEAQLFQDYSTQFSYEDTAPEEPYNGKPIRDIIFSGIKNISRSEIEALVNPYRSRLYFDYVHEEIYDRLFALGFFAYISTNRTLSSSGNEVIITFNVTEHPVISRINFLGNSGIRRNELNSVITSSVNDIFNPARVRVDIEAMINRYVERGYPNVIITTSETPIGESQIILNFHITEGSRLVIRNIIFQGNTRFTHNVLRNQLSLKAKSLINDGAFQEAKLIVDIEAVTKYYHDRGYIDAVVRDVTRSFEYTENEANMTLTFLIEEGNLFTFGGITFSGNVIFSTQQLERLINSREGEAVNSTRLEADLQRVADLYLENGYIFNSIVRVPDKNYQTYTLSYSVSIVERGRAYIENIIIRGNEKTNTEVILREIPLEPGDVFSRAKVMEAMRNLYNLQFFSVIIPEPSPGSQENLMDLTFIVEEQPTTDLQFGITFSGSADPDTFPISGMLKWNDRNLAGTGNQLGAEVSSTIVDALTLSVNYMHRWVFGLPLSAGVDFTAKFENRNAAMDNHLPIFYGNEDYAFPDGFNSREEYLANSSLPPREYMMKYDQWYLSLGFSTGYRWNTFLGILGLSGGARFGIIRNEYDDTLYRPFDPALRERNNEWTPKNSLWTSISLDQRDIFYDPSSGYYLYGRGGIYGLFTEEREHYLRGDVKAQYFLTLFDLPVTETWNFKAVLGFNSGLSVIGKQPGKNINDIAPPIENASKLSVDGMFVGRGWSSEFQNKGLLLWDNWAELRFPIVPGIIAFDFFFDAAGVESKEGYYFGNDDEGNPNFTLDNMRFSFGGGIRFAIPQFPIRLSFAKRFRFEDGVFKWMPGALFKDESNLDSGIDLVISFVLPY